jgi:hypothetical protein
MKGPEYERALARGRAIIATLPPADQRLADVAWELHCNDFDIELIVRTIGRSAARVSTALEAIQARLVNDLARGALVSVGYEGRALEDFVALLLTHEVETVVDVRMTPLSRKRGFSKRKLADALEDAGIGYVHERDLGNPKDNRQPFHDGNLDEGRARFFGILDEQHAALDRVVEMLDVSRVALLCFEREHDSCHRSCITERVTERRPDVDVVYA